MDDDSYNSADGMELTSQGAGTYWYAGISPASPLFISEATTLSGDVNLCLSLQVPASRVLRGGQGAAQDLQQGGRLVSRGHLLPVLVRTQGTYPPGES